jgi:nucleoside-diphosphate-sugar epimerase
MTMPDAIEALLRLEAADRPALTRKVYNVGSFNPSAGEVYDRVRQAFPETNIVFKPDARRQSIVDTWPDDVDDGAARRDWNWEPAYDLARAFDDYLIPAVTRRYRQRQG